MLLCDKLNVMREYGGSKPVPDYVVKNLNPRFELRPYQREAFENFITHFESDRCPRPTQVMFQMATGSGKTLIMAGLILYLYKRGYRNFLFFVNLTNIVEKTRDNFLNRESSKYLFADEIILDGERVRVNVTENFQHADTDAINICFTTTQGLHMRLWDPKENSLTLDDFNDCKTVLISDEAHHLNAQTKSERENRRTWEETVNHIFKRNAGNVLLEFTATCNINDSSIREKYESLIVYNYPLVKFYEDRYSKEIYTFRADARDRWLLALILSQYRLKIFQDHRLNIKPIILFKAAKIDDCKASMKKFIDDVKNLRGENLRELSERNGDEIIRRVFDYFAGSGISFEALAAELRDDFSAEHCIGIHSDSDAEANQILLNSLEDADNPYRVIFEVKKLDEGWDVLNLFDIVRLYETRQSRNATISEAQLIGRGARYCPFKIDDEQPKYQRKFDDDLTNDLRICETLYYHCQNDRQYVTELHDALREIGLDTKKAVRHEYKLKENFKRDNLYMNGRIFLNRREEINRDFLEIIPDKLYKFRRFSGKGGHDKILDDINDTEKSEDFHTTRVTLGQIAAKNYAAVNKALMKFPVYKFATLKKRFKNLQSTRQFITDEKFLGNIQIAITCNESEPDIDTLYAAAFDTLRQIADELNKTFSAYRGTTEFFARNVNEIFRDKTVNYSEKKAGSIGVSQNDQTVDEERRIDLSAADWFAYDDNFGTSEEKAFVAYFRDCVEELKKIYDKVYLVRNEREFAIYSFDDGARFEPDYVLFLLKESDGEIEQFQIFVEPKGEHLSAADAWKEKFLLQLKQKAIPVKIFADDVVCKIWGLPFYNRSDEKNFDSEFRTLIDRMTP